MSGAILLIILVSLSLIGIAVQSILVFSDRRRHYAAHHKTVMATITRVEEEIGAWYVVAIWLDEKEQRLYSFRSSALDPPATLREGEMVTVTFDPDNPLRYQMHL